MSMGISALANVPTPLFERKVKMAYDVYVADGGTMNFEEFKRLVWAFHKVQSIVSPLR